jgi:hypothetical protein
VAAIATHRFHPLKTSISNDALHQAAEHLLYSVPDATAALGGLGIPSGDISQAIRWMLCGSTTGPGPQDLWNWHSTTGTLHSQIDHCQLAIQG